MWIHLQATLVVVGKVSAPDSQKSSLHLLALSLPRGPAPGQMASLDHPGQESQCYLRSDTQSPLLWRVSKNTDIKPSPCSRGLNKNISRNRERPELCTT